MRLLVVDGCIRRENSRTKKLLDRFLETIKKGNGREAFQIETVDLMEENLKCLCGSFFEEREALLSEGKLGHPRFRLAHQFAEADSIVVGAPFWDLGIPALLKVYIENISVEGITFQCDEQGMTGLCKANQLLFFTTRGSETGDGEMEQGARYLKALCSMYGIPEFSCIFAEGLDIAGNNPKAIMETALRKANAAGEQWIKKQHMNVRAD